MTDVGLTGRKLNGSKRLSMEITFSRRERQALSNERLVLRSRLNFDPWSREVSPDVFVDRIPALTL